MLLKIKYLFFLFVGIQVSAQISSVPDELKRIQFTMIDTLDGWKKHANFNLNINQSLYENWQAGQTNQVELNSQLQYNFTYQKNNIIWDNLLLTDYGLNKVNGYEVRKTTDKIEFNTILGGKLPHHWSYSFFLNLQTQLTNTYNYDKDLNKENRIAGFLAPLYLTTGPGFMWRKNKNIHFNLAPITYKGVYLNGDVSKFDEDQNRFFSSNEIELYGIKPGERFRHKFGFYASAFYKFKAMNNVFIDNRFSLYSNYLDNPTHIDIDYTLNVQMKINKFMHTKLMFQTRYDDKERAGFQIKEALGVGFNIHI